MTSKGSPVWSWLGILCGALLCLLGIDRVVGRDILGIDGVVRRDIPLGIAEIAAGVSMALSRLFTKVGPLLAALILIFAGAGIAEVLLGYVVSAIPMFAVALLFLFIGRKNRRQTSRIPVA